MTIYEIYDTGHVAVQNSKLSYVNSDLFQFERLLVSSFY